MMRLIHVAATGVLDTAIILIIPKLHKIKCNTKINHFEGNMTASDSTWVTIFIVRLKKILRIHCMLT